MSDLFCFVAVTLLRSPMFLKAGTYQQDCVGKLALHAHVPFLVRFRARGADDPRVKQQIPHR
jgi:hypothetical protein